MPRSLVPFWARSGVWPNTALVSAPWPLWPWVRRPTRCVLPMDSYSFQGDTIPVAWPPMWPVVWVLSVRVSLRPRAVPNSLIEVSLLRGEVTKTSDIITHSANSNSRGTMAFNAAMMEQLALDSGESEAALAHAIVVGVQPFQCLRLVGRGTCQGLDESSRTFISNLITLQKQFSPRGNSGRCQGCRSS